MLKLSDNNDSKKLYSFEDQEFRNSEIQESINFGYNKEDNALNAPSPIQNNTMQELDIEFLKEYEDAISDRDKKIAELMYEIERLNKEKNNTISISNNKEIKQKLKTNFEFLAKLIKNIENLLTFHQISDESPKFISEEHKFEKVDILNVLNEALSSLEQDLNQFFELNSQNTTNYKHNDSSTQNFIKIDNNINHERISEFADNLKKENLELKFELQNSIQQIQELEIENIGLSDQISTLSKQSDNLKFLQSKINEKEEILQERNEKLEIEINEREEQHLKEMGGLKEKYNLLLEKKQEEIADLNNSKQSLLQFEVKIQDLLNDLNYKNSLLAPMNLKNKRLAGKIQALKKNFKKIIYDKMANFKYELNFLRKSFIESNLQIFDKLKTSLPALVQKFNLDKKLMEIDFEKVIHKQKNEFQLKINKYKGRIKDLKKEILLAREFKYEPPEETMNLMQSKFISEIDERKSFYPKDFMKETNFFKKAFLVQDQITQTEETVDKPSFTLNESLNKFEEQNFYVNKEITMLSNNMNTLEQDYKKFLNLYTENLNESTSKNSGNEAKIMSYIEKIYRRIEENTKKDERINSLVNRLSDKNHLEEEKFLRLNKTEIVEKENTKSIELQRIENQKNFLVRDNEKLKKKIAMKENEIREKNDIIDKLEKEKQISASQCKDLQVALHLKNAQYQIILNKTKNIYLQTEPTNNNMTPMVAERNPFERKLSYHQTNPFEKNIKESISTRSKDTLQTIKQIFQFKKK